PVDALVHHPVPTRRSSDLPVCAGEINTLMTSGRAVINCSGRLIRSQYRETGLKQSLTEISWVASDSSCCKTGAGKRVAKISPGINRTGILLMVAKAAPVTILVAPGPMDVVQTKASNRFFTLA